MKTKTEIQALRERLDDLEQRYHLAMKPDLGRIVREVRDLIRICRVLMTKIGPDQANPQYETIATPIDMLLFCPACGCQHVDESRPGYIDEEGTKYEEWDNPPHKSHLCADCGHIWRPADIYTNGVKEILTRGAKDSERVYPHRLGVLDIETINTVALEVMAQGHSEAARDIIRSIKTRWPSLRIIGLEKLQ